MPISRFSYCTRAVQDVTTGGSWVKGTWDSLYYFCNFLSICNYFKIKSLKKYKPTDHWSRSDCYKSLQTLVSISVLGNKLSQLALAKRLQLSVNSLFLLQLFCIFTMLFNLYLSSPTSTSLLICSRLLCTFLVLRPRDMKMSKVLTIYAYFLKVETF